MSYSAIARAEASKQLARFLTVGVLNTALQYLVFLLLYRLAHLHYLAASAVGYVVGMINSYLLNRRWTFVSSNSHVIGEMGRFVAVNCLSLLTNLAMMFSLVHTDAVTPTVAQLIALVGSVLVNFLLNRTWTFASRSPGKNHP